MDKLTFPLQGKTSMTSAMLKQAFYEQIEGDARFDKSIHAQYMAMDRTPAWYKGPDDSREMARSLADSAVDRVWSLDPREEHLFQVSGKTIWQIASGCLELKIFVIDENALGMVVNFTTHENALGMVVNFTTHDTKTYNVVLNP